MNNKLFNYIQAGIIAILSVFLLTQNLCSRQDTPVTKDCDEAYYVDVITTQTRQLDSLRNIEAYLRFKIDSLENIKTKIIKETKYITVYDTMIVDIMGLSYNSPEDFPLQVKLTDEYFKDSTYQVASTVFYRGKIEEVSTFFDIRKYTPNFIPTIKYVKSEPVVIKETLKQRRPRILVGAELETDNLVPDNFYASLAVQDNKGRLFSVSKSLVNNIGNFQNFKIQYLHPVIFSKLK